jgi:tRNA G18 (ribose-2'-O)-methylase SpoU
LEKVQISKKNDIFQLLETYKRNRAKRTKAKKMFVEGVIPINLLLQYSHDIEALIYDSSRQLSDWAKEVIIKSGTKWIYELSRDLMEELSDKDNPSELIALANQPNLTLKALNKAGLKRMIILDRPSNQGNLGAIIRSCDAFDIDLILISGHSVDPYDPKTISSSRGTVFKIPLIKLGSNNQLTELARELRKNHNFLFYGTSAKGTKDIRMGLTKTQPMALIIGNETTGMNEFLFELSDEVLTIPMMGAATSLNIACAASIMIYEMAGVDIP